MRYFGAWPRVAWERRLADERSGLARVVAFSGERTTIVSWLQRWRAVVRVVGVSATRVMHRSAASSETSQLTRIVTTGWQPWRADARTRLHSAGRSRAAHQITFARLGLGGYADGDVAMFAGCRLEAIGV